MCPWPKYPRNESSSLPMCPARPLGHIQAVGTHNSFSQKLGLLYSTSSVVQVPSGPPGITQVSLTWPDTLTSSSMPAASTLILTYPDTISDPPPFLGRILRRRIHVQGTHRPKLSFGDNTGRGRIDMCTEIMLSFWGQIQRAWLGDKVDSGIGLPMV